MTDKQEIERSFKQKGNVVVMKERVSDIEITPKDILINIDSNQNQINQLEQQRINAENAIVKCNEGMANLRNTIKQLKKFEEWAVNCQVSKLKSIVEEIMQETIKKVNDTFEEDPVLTELQNNLHRFRQFQHYLAAHEKVVNEIAPRIYKEHLIINCYLDNPWLKE